MTTWKRKEIKDKAKKSFRANFWKCVATALILVIVGGGTAGAFGGGGGSAFGHRDEESAGHSINLVNEDWNFSAPHGAGRIMSRSRARDAIDMDDYRKAMEGIYTTSVNPSTLDEAPMAYKSLEDIIDVIEESVDVIEVLKPVFNYKAS